MSDCYTIHSARPRGVSPCRGSIALQQAMDRRVRRNYPYRGAADGLTTALRRLFKPKDYLGLEIEINQALLASVSFHNVARTLVETIRQTWNL